MTRLKHLLPLLVLMAGLIACSKDDPDPPGTGEGEAVAVLRGRGWC